MYAAGFPAAGPALALRTRWAPAALTALVASSCWGQSSSLDLQIQLIPPRFSSSS